MTPTPDVAISFLVSTDAVPVNAGRAIPARKVVTEDHLTKSQGGVDARHRISRICHTGCHAVT